MMTDDPRWRFAFNRVAGLVIDSYSMNLYPSARILSDYDQLDVMAYPNDLEIQYSQTCSEEPSSNP